MYCRVIVDIVHENVAKPFTYLIPDGMELTDLDMDPGEILKQLFATRRNYQKAETRVHGLKARLVSLQETLAVMQQVIAEGLADE